MRALALTLAPLVVLVLVWSATGAGPSAAAPRPSGVQDVSPTWEEGALAGVDHDAARREILARPPVELAERAPLWGPAERRHASAEVGELHGLVVDWDDAPLDGRMVLAIPGAQAAERIVDGTFWDGSVPDTSDGKGRYRCSGLAPGRWRVGASHDGDVWAWSASVDVRGGGVTEVPNLVLGPAPVPQKLRGIVRDGSSAPVAKAQVAYRSSRGRSGVTGTDEEGRFVVHGAWGEVLHLHVYGHRGTPLCAEVTGEVGGGTVQLFVEEEDEDALSRTNGSAPSDW